jgi:hypothetical protein
MRRCLPWARTEAARPVHHRRPRVAFFLPGSRRSDRMAACDRPSFRSLVRRGVRRGTLARRVAVASRRGYKRPPVAPRRRSCEGGRP